MLGFESVYFYFEKIYKVMIQLLNTVNIKMCVLLYKTKTKHFYRDEVSTSRGQF